MSAAQSRCKRFARRNVSFEADFRNVSSGFLSGRCLKCGPPAHQLQQGQQPRPQATTVDTGAARCNESQMTDEI